MTSETENVGGVSAGQLRSFIERIERLEEEKSGISEDIKSILSEAKGDGFDTKVLRRVLALRKKSREDRKEEEELVRLYMAALGME